MNGNKNEVLWEYIHSFCPASHAFMTVFHDFRVVEGIKNIHRGKTVFTTSVLYQVEVEVDHLNK